MAKQYVDVWKYPHMTYKKAFVIATIISIITGGVAFFSFSYLFNATACWSFTYASRPLHRVAVCLSLR